MQLRTSARLLSAVGALTLAATLTSCGFDYATDRVYTPGTGSNARDAEVDVLGAVVVSAVDGSGTLVTSFSNNDGANQGTVQAISGAGDVPVTVGAFEPITIAPGGLVSLADDGGIELEGDFGPGGYLTLAIDLGDDGSVTVPVPVVAPCNEFEGLDVTGDGSLDYDCDVESDEPAAH